jgi:hypothetical protein
MGKDESTYEALRAAAEPRELRRQLDQWQEYVATLRLARGHLVAAKPEDEEDFRALDDVIATGHSRVERLTDLVGGRIVSRRRPKKTVEGQRSACLVFLDECGSHALRAREHDFGAFALSAVIIEESKYSAIDRAWKEWKQSTWGDPERLIHEPEIRRGNGAFWFDGAPARRSEVRESLAAKLADLDFKLIVVVVHRAAYLALHGRGPLDCTLPVNVYHMALDFLCERLVLALNESFSDSVALVVAEARGAKEDASLQLEFARLHLDGTSYIAPSWFRHQLQPGIEFGTKPDRITGLELADLAARPVAEKVLKPGSTPDRWPVFASKLCRGQATKHSPLGLKILPWEDKYGGIWKS